MPKISTDKTKINELLTRGVHEAIDFNELQAALGSGRQLRVKLGIDPTSAHLHMGRSIPLLKLRDFQELGHQIVFIVGDFTGIIGDTSDKEAERPMLLSEQVQQNMKTYVAQVGKILDIKKCEVNFNSKWLKKLGFAEIGELANLFSVAEFIGRENIKKRLEGGKRVSLREVLYPLMQGYDSVAVRADVEVGGTDQRFNLLAGRTIQSAYKQRPQNILMNPLVAGLDGRKMSSSWGNTINLDDAPADMYGKVMSLLDELLVDYFVFCTRVDLREVEKIKAELAAGANPRDAKMRLAREVVGMYWGAAAVAAAEAEFVQVHQKHEAPDEIPVVRVSWREASLVDALVEAGLCSSKGDARRQIEQGGIKVDGAVVKDVGVKVKVGAVIQKGKRYFVKVE